MTNELFQAISEYFLIASCVAFVATFATCLILDAVWAVIDHIRG